MMKRPLLYAGILAMVLTLSSFTPATAEEPSDTGAVAAAKPEQAAAGHDREAFQAHFFLGSAIDNFAADEVTRYLNPEASGDVQTFERLIAGIDFSYRLLGKAGDERQLWAYGGTVHGVRSTDVDCMEDSTLPVCQDFIDAGAVTSERFLFIARNASSLEAALGLRWEVKQLQRDSLHPSKLFVSGQYGFLTVDGAGDDVQDLYHYGIGVMASGGRFRSSYVEIARGGSDLFTDNPDDRWKIIGQVNWWPETKNKSFSAFARILVDADFDDGADSVQSYFGLRWDLSKLFAGGNAGGKKEAKDGGNTAAAGG